LYQGFYINLPPVGLTILLLLILRIPEQTAKKPLTDIQSFLPGNQVAIANSLIFFSRSFGGALFLSLAQAILANSLPSALYKYAPNADAQAIISTGATGFQSLIDKSDLTGVVLAFTSTITNTYVSHFILLPSSFQHQMTD
jgi:hypothetical protein